MATISYVRITNASGTVLTGDNGATWTPVDGVSFGTATASGGKPAAQDLTFALSQSSGLSPQLKSILAAGSALQVEVATYDPSTATASSVGTLQSYDVFGGTTSTNAAAFLRTEALKNGNADVYTVGSSQVSQASYAGGQQVSASAFSKVLNKAVPAAAAPAAVLAGSLLPATTTSSTPSTDFGDLSYYVSFQTAPGTYVTATGSTRNPLTPSAGSASSWFSIIDPSSGLQQALNSVTTGSAGAGAGKVAFGPVSFTLGSDLLDPTLYQALTSGKAYTSVKIEATRPDGTVADSTTLSLVAVQSLAKGSAGTTATLQYSSYYSQHAADTIDGRDGPPNPGSGWDAVVNKPVDAPSATGVVVLRGYEGPNDGAYPVSLPYYAYVTPYTGGSPIAGDTPVQFASSSQLKSLLPSGLAFAPTNVSFTTTQTANSGSQSSGAGVGRVQFSPLGFDLTADAASAAFDGLLFAGKPMRQLSLVQGVGSGGLDIRERDNFALVGVSTDTLDLLAGTRSLGLTYGALQIASKVPTTSTSGTSVGTVPVAAWNRVLNNSNFDVTSGSTTPVVAVKSLAVATPSAAAASSSSAAPQVLVAAAAPQPTPVAGTAAYVQFRDASGKVITGGANGSSWFALSAASTKFQQGLDLGSGATGASRVVLGDLDLTLAPGAITAVLDRTLGAGGGITAEVASYNGNALLNDYVFGGAGLTADTPSATGNALTFQYTGVQEIAYTSGVASTPVTWNGKTNSTAFSASTAAPVSSAPSVRKTPSQLVTYAEFVGADGKLLAGSGGKTLFATQNVDGGLKSTNGTGAPTVSPLSLSLGDDGIVSAIEGASAPVGVVLVSYDADNQRHLVSYQTYGGVVLSGDTLDNTGGDHQLTFSPAAASAAPYGAAASALAPVGYTEQMPNDFAPDGSSSYSTAAGGALPSVGALAKGVAPGQARPYQSFTGESFSAEVAANGVDLTDPVSNGLVAASNVSVDFVAKTGSFAVAASALPGLTQALTAGKPVTVTLQAAFGPNVEGLTFGGGGPTNSAVLTGASLDAATGLADVSFKFNGTPGTYAVGGGVGFLGEEIYQDQMVVTPEAAAAAGTAKFDIAFTNKLAPTLTADQLLIVDGKNDGAAPGVTGTITLAPGTTAGTYVATVSGLSGSGPFSVDVTPAFKQSAVANHPLSATNYVGSEVLATDTTAGTQSFTVATPNAPTTTTTFSTATGLPTKMVVLNPDSDTQSVTTTYAADGTTPTLTATLLKDGTYVTVAPASSSDPAGTATVVTTFASATAATPLRTVYENASGLPIESVDTSGSNVVTTVYAADGTTPQTVTTARPDGTSEIYKALPSGPFASSDVVYAADQTVTQATYRRAGGILAEVDTFGTDGTNTVALYDTTGAPLETTVTNSDTSKAVTQYEAVGPYASVTTTYDATGKQIDQTEVARAPTVTLDGAGGAVTTPTATVTGRIDIPGVAGTVQLSVNGTAAGSPVALNADGTFSAVLPFAANGTYDVTATATTAVGGVGTTAAAAHYTVSDIAPTVAITSPAATGASAARTITGLVTASGTAGVAGQTVTLTEDGVALATAAPVTVGPDGTFSADVVLPAEGANAITISVLDSLGNAASASITETLDQVAPAVSSPTLTVAPGAGPTAVGIAAPSDDVSAQGALTIVVGGLPGDGTLTLADGTTAVTAGMNLTAAQLSGLLFTPTAGLSGQSGTFTYTVADEAGNGSTGTATLAIGDPAPGIPPAAPAPGASPTAGGASPAPGVAPAVPAPATTVDGSGRTTTTVFHADGSSAVTVSGGPFFDGKRYGSFTRNLAPDGTLLNTVRDGTNGSHGVFIEAGGQTVGSDHADTFFNGGRPATTFVFTPGYGRDVVNLFRADGADHDSLSFKGSDFGSTPAGQLASLLAHTQEKAGNLVITDPTSHDRVVLTGIDKKTLIGNERDLIFRP